MRLYLTFLCLVTTCFSNPRQIPWSALEPLPNSRHLDLKSSDIHFLWNQFLSAYKLNVKDVSFEVFLSNLLAIYEHNQKLKTKNSTFEMGINSFAGMNEAEFRKRLGFRSHLKLSSIVPRYTYTAFHAPLPRFVDWRKRGFVTPVKDQGSCGSCWAFSATGSLEGQIKSIDGRLISLSEQQLVDCSVEFNNAGCSGGFMDNAFEYIKVAGGIETEHDYPYISGFSGEANSECYFNLSKVAARVKGYVDVRSGDENSLMEALAIKGPISVGVSAGRQSFIMYHSGIYDDPNCGNTSEALDHGVLLVGFGEEKGIPYWIVKNSWGPSWGEGGYIRIKRHNNLCGVATSASYPLILSSDAVLYEDAF